MAQGEPGSPTLFHALLGLVAQLRQLVAERRRNHPASDGPGFGVFIGERDLDRAIAEAEAGLSELGSVPDGLELMARSCALDELSTSILVAAAAPHLHGGFGTAYAYLNDDLNRRELTAGLAVALGRRAPLDLLARQNLSDAGGLRSSRLIEVEAGPPWPQRRITTPDRVVRQLLGDTQPDLAVARCVEPTLALASAGAEAVAANGVHGGWAYAELASDDAIGSVVGGLAQLGLGTLHVNLARCDPDTEIATLITDAAREALFQGLALLIGPLEAVQDGHLLGQLERVRGITVVYGRGGWNPVWSTATPEIIEVPALRLEERARLWDQAATAFDLSLDVDSFASSFRLTPAALLRSLAGHSESVRNQPDQLARAIVERIHQHSVGGLAETIRRIRPKVSRASIVLPAGTMDELDGLISWCRNRDLVADRYGVRGQGSGGRGVTALFSGASGTGKTLAAEVVAAELGVDLYRVDLSTVVSKYIGETEQNLSGVFAAAERASCVLLFDEADALFGKRSAVDDARDRYANLEVSYLLQRLEEFDGVSILTTNLEGNLDTAFTRRLGCMIRFPQPEADERYRLWKLHLPDSVPGAGQLDLRLLADRFPLAGGAISSAATIAAHSVARSATEMTMEVAADAVARQYEKLGWILDPVAVADVAAATGPRASGPTQ